MYHHVKIYYGPCNSFNTLSHKPQKVRGIRDYLQKIGYRVELTPVDFENYCVMEMCGHEIFRCNIQNLRFNTYYKYDPVAQRAVAAVINASSKFERARTYLWFRTLLEVNMFRSDFLKDTWTTPNKIKNTATLEECCKCCDILVSKK